MEAELFFLSGSMKGKRYRLDPARQFTLGRSANVELQIDDHNVSRAHCRIEFRNGEWQILDLDSSNGSYVNGERVRNCRLKPGDAIRLGGQEMRFGLSSEDPEITAPGTRLRLVAEAPRADSRTIRMRFDEHDAALIPVLNDPNVEREVVTRLQGQLEAIYGLSNLIHGEGNLDTIFNLANETILEVSGATRSAILMKDEDSGTPQPKAIRVRRGTLGGNEFPVSSTIVEETLRQGLSLLSSDAQTDQRFKAGASIMMQGIKSVMCVPVRAGAKTTGVIYVDTNSAVETFNESDLRLLAAIGKQVGVAIERARLISDLQLLFIGVIHTLVATIEAKDPYTKGHSERVTSYALVLARELGLDLEARLVVELAGLLHDVGKIGIPEAILNKAGRLDEAEFNIVRSHPVVGADIIRNIQNIDRLVSMDAIVAAVRHHHEEFDGSGYPDGLKGEAIPMSARILAIADTYDAITSDRPYRKGGDREKAAREIRENSGSQFDPTCVEAFDAVFASGRFEEAGRLVSAFALHG